jgi:hypothetical protein|tara:strand:+ start:1030 stop:1200 length:171 start_codon:yes stop_codon:yes gene_type:complete
MLKKIYKKDGIIIVSNENDNNYSMEFYYFMINNYQKEYSIQDYLKKYYISKGFIYS